MYRTALVHQYMPGLGYGKVPYRTVVTGYGGVLVLVL